MTPAAKHDFSKPLPKITHTLNFIPILDILLLAFNLLHIFDEPSTSKAGVYTQILLHHTITSPIATANVL